MGEKAGMPLLRSNRNPNTPKPTKSGKIPAVFAPLEEPAACKLTDNMDICAPILKWRQDCNK